MNFVVSHDTDISQLGVYDGGTPLTSDELVGIFDDSTGNLVGSEVAFGPGYAGTQTGDTFFESVPEFTLTPAEYSIVSLGAAPTSGNAGGSSGNNSLGNLGDALNLPGGDRFNSGTTDVVGPETGTTSSSLDPLCLVDPVPDGGLTLAMLGTGLASLGLLRRKS